MRSGVRAAAAAALLISPAVLAFLSGGFFGKPRLVAGIIAWALVAAVALAASRPIPRSAPARLALAGLAGLAALTALSITWAPLKDPALADAERLALYAAALIAGCAVLRGNAARLVEPALAVGITAVCLYALATRLLPGIVETIPSYSAGPRLEQPISYWNALGAFAAMGAVLAARIGSDPERPAPLRAAGAAVLPALGLTVYLTLSRGALVALAAGGLMLILLSTERRTLQTLGIGVVTSALMIVLAAGLPAVDDLLGSMAEREKQGLEALGALMMVAGAAGFVQYRIAERRTVRTYIAVAGAVLLTLVGLGRAAAPDPGLPEPVKAPAKEGVQLPQDKQRLRTLKTNRTKYWRVAIDDGFAEQPLRGVGAHGFAQLWLQHRDITEAAQDAHSLYIETAAELGLLGLALLGAFMGGVGWAAVRLRRSPAATGAIAVGTVFAVHAGLDWDFEMPAVALVFLILAGLLVAADDEKYAGKT